MEKYDLNNNKIDGYIYSRVKKGMYGLTQAGIIAHEVPKTHLKPYGYAPERITQEIYTHKDRDIDFILVVEDFGIKYKDKKYLEHLIESLQTIYEVTQHWAGGL